MLVTTDDLGGCNRSVKTWLAKFAANGVGITKPNSNSFAGKKAIRIPKLIRRLNLNVKLDEHRGGTVLQVPDVDYPVASNKAAFAVIHLGGQVFGAFDTETNLLAHFPCSIAANVEKRPVGELHVAVVAPPPELPPSTRTCFPESPEARQLKMKLIFAAPVRIIRWCGLGLVWTRLATRIACTPIPEQVGRTESHGCFRLANWDAGIPVEAGVGGVCQVLVEP